MNFKLKCIAGFWHIFNTFHRLTLACSPKVCRQHMRGGPRAMFGSCSLVVPSSWSTHDGPAQQNGQISPYYGVQTRVLQVSCMGSLYHLLHFPTRLNPTIWFKSMVRPLISEFSVFLSNKLWLHLLTFCDVPSSWVFGYSFPSCCCPSNSNLSFWCWRPKGNLD